MVKGNRDKGSRAIGQTTQVGGQCRRMVDNEDLGRGLKESLRAWAGISLKFKSCLYFLLASLCLVSPAANWNYSTNSSKDY